MPLNTDYEARYRALKIRASGVQFPPCQIFANLSTVSGYLSTIRINRAACALGRARPCSQFSRVRTLVRRYFANNARDRFMRSRKADSSFADIFGVALV